jgi:hypothetical protein
MILIEDFNIVDSLGKVQVDSRTKKTACCNASQDSMKSRIQELSKD